MPVNTDHLLRNESLKPGQSLISRNGEYSLDYQQTDGNLVLYRNSNRQALWHSKTNGRPGKECIMQTDGNLVIYGHGGNAIWHTSTHGHPGSRLLVQADGNVVIYNANNQPIWATKTVEGTVPSGPRAQGDKMKPGEVLDPGQSLISQNGKYSLNYQHTDGNLVLYRIYGMRPLWASKTNGRPGRVCIMQTDGNLVIYGHGSHVIWHTSTHGHHQSWLVVQDDGNMLILNSKNWVPRTRVVWQTGTAPPVLSKFTPTSGQSGSSIIIEGNNFKKDNNVDNLVSVETVLFGGVRATQHTVNSRTQVSAIVPANATSGPITVITQVGSAVSRESFTITAPPPTTKQPADLVVIDTWTGPNEIIDPNSPFTVYFNIVNYGGSATGKFSVRFALNNEFLTPDLVVDSYEPRTQGVVSWTFTKGLPSGKYHLHIILDVLNQVAESAEWNNTSRNGFTVR